MTAPSTYDLYRKLAAEQPIKAARYQRSIRDTLTHPNIHELERARLGEALRGIADGLPPLCGRCGAVLSDPDSIARGLGPDCAELVAKAS